VTAEPERANPAGRSREVVLFAKVLIANRGEIACRIIATAKRMGIKTVALHTPTDRGARFTRLADEVVEVANYLDGGAIVAAAKGVGADCLHPGYGFLSENADFAEYCGLEGVTFIGPPPSAMRAMGYKSAAKALVARSGAPVLPGYHGDNQTAKFLKETAYQIGYPVLIKASAGGGGRGIRRVDAHVEFEAALESAQREAQAAFGDSRVLIEKCILAPRHIEVQVFGDSHGNVVHLGERDCSLQRRRQKLIEESPAPGLLAPTRAAMTEAAVTAAKAVGYVGAGTVEFIADPSRGMGRDSFYFLEMNTRLQVEHPVTEAVYGVDLVEWQFRIAAGEPLPLTQPHLIRRGAAIEARLNAEDPETGFLPSPGRLLALKLDGLDVRVDTGVEEGDEVSPHYDSLIAKLIAFAPTRDEAIAKLDSALARAVVLGPKTNLAFLRGLLAAPEFAAGRHDTGFIDANLERLGAAPQPPDAFAALAGVRALLGELTAPPTAPADADPWSQADGFELMGPRRAPFDARVNGRREGFVAISQAGATEIAFRDGRSIVKVEIAPTVLAVEDGVLVMNAGRQTHVGPFAGEAEAGDEGAGEGIVVAPMPGRIVALDVAEGETVEAGRRLAVLEAMKMEHALTAPRAGRVRLAGPKAGDNVAQGAAILTVEALVDAPSP
jgi:3-methylcrotonyl-CoA carboxylase alpha subunit